MCACIILPTFVTTTAFATSPSGLDSEQTREATRYVLQSFDDRFASYSALHLVRWYATLSFKPAPHVSPSLWQQRMTDAALEAMQCVNASLPRYITSYRLQHTLPSVDAKLAKSRLVNDIYTRLYPPGTSTLTMENFEHNIDTMRISDTADAAEGALEKACLQASPLPSMRLFMALTDDAEQVTRLAQAINPYPEVLP